jgi:hypothetical protein
VNQVERQGDLLQYQMDELRRTRFSETKMEKE